MQNEEDELDSRTMVKYSGDSGTLVPGSRAGDDDNDNNTMIAHSDVGTLVSPIHSTTDSATLESDLGTMVINSDGEDEDSTMKSNSLFSYYSFYLLTISLSYGFPTSGSWTRLLKMIPPTMGDRATFLEAVQITRREPAIHLSRSQQP